jgi:hypothetical protein
VIDHVVDVVDAGIRYGIYDPVLSDEVPGPEIGVAAAAVNRKFSWQYGKAWLVGHCERLRGSNNIKKAYWVASQIKGTIVISLLLLWDSSHDHPDKDGRIYCTAKQPWISQPAGICWYARQV